MRTVAFLPGTSDEFLRALGVPYGQLVIEGCDPIEVISLAGARGTLKEAVERRFINMDTAAHIGGEISAAGVLADLGDIFRRATQHPMPKDLGRVVQFDTACPDTPKLTAAMPQGRLVSSTGKPLCQTITTLTAGFVVCRGLAELGLVRLFDMCTLLRDMSSANLAMDDAEYRARWDALPGTQRQEIEAEARAAQVRMTAQMFERHPLLAALFGGTSNDE